MYKKKTFLNDNNLLEKERSEPDTTMIDQPIYLLIDIHIKSKLTLFVKKNIFFLHLDFSSTRG
jgi:hypothetical protein